LRVLFLASSGGTEGTKGKGRAEKKEKKREEKKGGRKYLISLRSDYALTCIAQGGGEKKKKGRGGGRSQIFAFLLAKGGKGKTKKKKEKREWAEANEGVGQPK